MSCKTHKTYPIRVGRRLACSLLATLVLLSLPAFAQFTPSDDSYVNSKAATTNYGAAKTLDISSAGETTFIRFDLTAVPSGYTGSSIAKATLKLYVNTITTAGSFNVDLVNGTWTEGKIDNSNAPALGATIAASVPLTTANKLDYVSIDITQAMVDWLNGTANDGIALVANSPLVAMFDSKETTTTSHPPELDIVFAGGGGGITGINTASGSGLTGGGNSGVLNLSLLTSCASGQVLDWNGSAWVCANLSGGGTITGVTAGTDLTGGGASGNVTLNLDTTKVPQLAASNSFTNQIAVSNSTGTIPLFAVQNDTTRVDNAIEGAVYSPQNGSAAVVGTAFAKTGAVFGVQGSIGNSTNTGAGIYGTNGPASVTGSVYKGGGSGVWGDSGAAGFGQQGVLGTADAGNAIDALNNSTVSASLLAENQNTAKGALAPAVAGFSFGPQGIGVVGSGPVHSNNFLNSVGASAIGVVGDAGPGSATGVLGTADVGIGVYGISTSSAGVIGQSTGNSGVFGETLSTNSNGGPYAGVSGADFGAGSFNAGVYATSVNGNAIGGHNSGATEATTAFFLNDGERDSFNQVIYAASTQNPAAFCSVMVNGDFMCTGSKSAAVQLPDKSWKRLYAVESPENWFEDFGSGQLSNGSAEITLEPTFARTVNTAADYRVFPVPDGDCNGLYIAQKTATGFVVRELGGGKSNVAFDYRVVARRRGYENVRMADVTELQARNAVMVDRVMKEDRQRPAAAAEAGRAHPAPQIEMPVWPRSEGSRHSSNRAAAAGKSGSTLKNR